MSETKERSVVKVDMNRGVVLNDSGDVLRFAKFIADARLAPSSYRTPADIFIGIVSGMEHGFTAMQSLQAIAVINQKPCLYGDALPALVHRSGKCEYIRERFEGDGDGMSAVCIVKRRDQAEPTARTFSVADAKIGGLWGKAGPWKSYPRRMLQMRARAFAFRDAFADVLAGFGVVEEMQDVATQADPTPSLDEYDEPATTTAALPSPNLLDEYEPQPSETVSTEPA